MKKLVVLILSLQILSSGMFLDQVLRVRQLVSHYLEHLHENRMDLGQFLTLHYFDPEHDRTDPVRHAELPLHHHADSISGIVFKGMIEQINVDLDSPSQERSYLSILAHHHGLTDPMSIFQPPRLA